MADNEAFSNFTIKLAKQWKSRFWQFKIQQEELKASTASKKNNYSLLILNVIRFTSKYNSSLTY